MRVLKGFLSTVDLVNKILGYVLSLILLTMTILIAWQVITRFVLGNPSSFSEELSRFLMIYLIMIGSAVATRTGGMISVDVLLEAFESTKLRPILIIGAQILSMIFYLILTVYGFQFAENSFNQIAPGTQISMGWIYLSIPIGAIFLIMNSIGRIVSVIIGEEVETE
ncbi:TRAP transporter small permease [Salinicoccus sp. YB14-2]|uniref:TRAP transporter small permease n=1 Tax=Salinicoccus sp. YB14-2 TaxID=1572701 RepID=UPI00068FCBD2|nr:TRAP transporter small permease [Salinicoccus sp. YB14-2]